MIFVRIAIALVLTIGMLYIAKSTSDGRPEFVTHSENGYTFEMTTVTKGFEDSLMTILVTITGDIQPTDKMQARFTRLGQGTETPLQRYRTIPLVLVDSANGTYQVRHASGQRGGRVYYYFEIRDAIGGQKAQFTQPDSKPFLMKYIGVVPTFVVGPHVFFMFASVFAMVMAAFYAIGSIAGGGRVSTMASWLGWATVFALLGSVPFGIGMNYYAFGVYWEAVPFGTDATDNKAQLMLVYIIFATVAGLGSLTKGRFGRDLFASRTMGWLGISAFLVMLAIYFIPHSIQFSAELTHTFCYSFIGFVAILYLFGRLRSKSRT